MPPIRPPSRHKKLFAHFQDGQVAAVASLEAAAELWNDFRERSEAGVSEIGNGVRVTDEKGHQVGRISYNGRIWEGSSMEKKFGQPREEERPEAAPPRRRRDQASLFRFREGARASARHPHRITETSGRPGRTDDNLSLDVVGFYEVPGVLRTAAGAFRHGRLNYSQSGPHASPSIWAEIADILMAAAQKIDDLDNPGSGYSVGARAYLHEKIPQLRQEGRPEEVAKAIAMDMARRHGFKVPPRKR